MDEHVMAGSTAANPDLSWSQVRETLLMLELAVAQISHALMDSNSSIDTLTRSFTKMCETVQAIETASTQLPNDKASESATAIRAGCADVKGQTLDAIVAFQFYDKMAQRLQHVCQSMDQLANLISDPRRLYTPAEWAALQQAIKSKYSVEAERLMFDYIMQGLPVEEALKRAMTQHQAETREGDLELF